MKKVISFSWPDLSAPTPQTKGALEISQKLHTAGYTAYWAGGCVRDALLGRIPKDIDIATDAPTEEIEKIFTRTIGVGKQFGVIVVPLTIEEVSINFEVAIFRSDGIYSDGRRPDSITPSNPEEDATRRDFTLNGLFYDPATNTVIDFVNGIEDLNSKTIRAIGDPHKRFHEDKLRLMRGVRFSVEFQYELEKETEKAIQQSAEHINTVSQERIRDELNKMFIGRSPGDAIRLLSHCKLLQEILPEIECFKGVEQPPQYHPEGDVWVHVLKMLDMVSYGRLELVLGILMHDIAKPATFTRAPDRIRFHNHQNIGADMTVEILSRLKYPNKVIQTVRELTLQHLKFADVHKMKKGRLKNFILQEDFDLHLELHRIDCLGSHGMLQNHALCLDVLQEIKNAPEKTRPLITGQNLKECGYKPGPLFKVILDDVFEAQLEGLVQTKEECIDYINKKWPEKLTSSL